MSYWWSRRNTHSRTGSPQELRSEAPRAEERSSCYALVGLFQNIPAVHAEKISVALDRSPAWRRMLQQLFQSHGPHLPLLFTHRAGVIHHDVIHLRELTLHRPLAPPDKNHGMKRRTLLQLEIEKQISRPGLPDIARDKKRVQSLQRPSIRKLRVSAVPHIFRRVNSRLHPKQCRL